MRDLVGYGILNEGKMKISNQVDGPVKLWLLSSSNYADDYDGSGCRRNELAHSAPPISYL
jgi:hypothetical protein